VRSNRLKKLILALSEIDEEIDVHEERLNAHEKRLNGHDGEIKGLVTRAAWVEGKIEKRGRPKRRK
jgi:hypothetical protein